MSVDTETFTEQILPAALDALQGYQNELGNSHALYPGIIGGAALMLVGGLVASDELRARQRPMRTTPYLEVIPAASGKPTGKVVGYAPGFNSHPRKPGNIYAKTARNYADVIIEHDPETGYDSELSHATFAEKCLELGAEEVELIGDSGGGIKQLSKAVSLITKYGLDARVTQVSTPNRKRHIKGWYRHMMLAFLDAANQTGVYGGDGFRQFAEIVGYKIDNPRKSLRDARAHLQRKFGGDSFVTSRQVIRYAPLLRRHDTAADLRFLGPERVRMASTDAADKDKVVWVRQSHEFMEEHAGGTVPWNQLPELGHANVCEVPGAAADIVRWIFEKQQTVIPMYSPHKAA